MKRICHTIVGVFLLSFCIMVLFGEKAFAVDEPTPTVSDSDSNQNTPTVSNDDSNQDTSNETKEEAEPTNISKSDDSDKDRKETEENNTSSNKTNNKKKDSNKKNDLTQNTTNSNTTVKSTVKPAENNTTNSRDEKNDNVSARESVSQEENEENEEPEETEKPEETQKAKSDKTKSPISLNNESNNIASQQSKSGDLKIKFIIFLIAATITIVIFVVFIKKKNKKLNNIEVEDNDYGEGQYHERRFNSPIDEAMDDGFVYENSDIIRPTLRYYETQENNNELYQDDGYNETYNNWNEPNYNEQGFVNQGYNEQNYNEQDFVNQEYNNPNYNEQNFANQGYNEQDFANQGYNNQNYYGQENLNNVEEMNYDKYINNNVHMYNEDEVNYNDKQFSSGEEYKNTANINKIYREQDEMDFLKKENVVKNNHQNVNNMQKNQTNMITDQSLNNNYVYIPNDFTQWADEGMFSDQNESINIEKGY